MKDQALEALHRQIERAGLPPPDGITLEWEDSPNMAHCPLAWQEQKVAIVYHPDGRRHGRGDQSRCDYLHFRISAWLVSNIKARGWTPVVVTPEAIKDGSALAAVRRALQDLQ